MGALHRNKARQSAYSYRQQHFWMMWKCCSLQGDIPAVLQDWSWCFPGTPVSPAARQTNPLAEWLILWICLFERTDEFMGTLWCRTAFLRQALCVCSAAGYMASDKSPWWQSCAAPSAVGLPGVLRISARGSHGRLRKWRVLLKGHSELLCHQTELSLVSWSAWICVWTDCSACNPFVCILSFLFIKWAYWHGQFEVISKCLSEVNLKPIKKNHWKCFQDLH